MIKARSLHLFEFMDQGWLPLGVRNTMREILECVNARPFRPYYAEVVDLTLSVAASSRAEAVVELGAGTAPLTRRLAQDPRCTSRLVPCDLNPDHESYHTLVKQFGERVQPSYDLVDFSEPQTWPPGTMLVLSATLHHLPDEARSIALRSMAESADVLLIVEPLRRTIISMLFVCGSVGPALLLPCLMIRRPGLLRRILWSWLIPIAPAAFLWDGWISCLRQWSDAKYREEIDRIDGVTGDVRHTLFTQIVTLRKHPSSLQ